MGKLSVVRESGLLAKSVGGKGKYQYWKTEVNIVVLYFFSPAHSTNTPSPCSLLCFCKKKQLYTTVYLVFEAHFSHAQKNKDKNRTK